MWELLFTVFNEKKSWEKNNLIKIAIRGGH